MLSCVYWYFSLIFCHELSPSNLHTIFFFFNWHKSAIWTGFWFSSVRPPLGWFGEGWGMHFQHASMLPYSVAVELSQKGTRNNLSLKAWLEAVQHHFCHIWTQKPKSLSRFKRKDKNSVCGAGQVKDLQPSLIPTTSHWREQTSYSPFPSLHPWNTAPGELRVFLSTHLRWL